MHTGLVRPLYACVIWCPLQLGDMTDIEKVLRCVTKIVSTLKDKPYYDRLISLNLPIVCYVIQEEENGVICEQDGVM